MSAVTHSEDKLQKAFRAVPLRFLKVGDELGFDIYLKLDVDDPSKQAYIIFMKEGQTFTEESLDRLRQCGVPRVYVHPSKSKEYHAYVEGHLSKVIADDTIALEERAAILYASVQESVRDFLEDPRSKDLIPRSNEIVQTTSRFLRTKDRALRHLIRLTSYDYYTYTHSVNVFVLSLALAERTMQDDGALHDFGVGALLHDIGKSDISPDIVNCKGRLTPEQFEEMKKHTVYGHRIVAQHGGIDPVALDVIRHHHEKLNGRGYPDQFRGDEISTFARILTIADIFDALTTRRAYKDAIASYYAFTLMKEDMAREIDMGLFGAFVQMIADQRDD